MQKSLRKKYGKWKVIGTHSGGKVMCKCECGLVKLVQVQSLRNGKSKGCFLCSRKDMRKCFSSRLWNSLIERTRKRNMKINISQNEAWKLYIAQNGKCALTGDDIRLAWDGVQTASLDRIDSSKGYVKGNVQWVHKDINYMKKDLEEKYFVGLCSFVANHKGKKS